MVWHINLSFFKKIPFSYLWIIRKAIGSDIKSMLDLGCGDGELMQILSRGENWKVTGIDVYKKYLKTAKRTGIYKEVILGDITALPEKIYSNKFDLVFCSQALEHLTKSVGVNAIKRWEKLSKKRIVISTPVGFIPYSPLEGGEENNPFQEHRSGWYPDELRRLGYRVHGQGLRLVYGYKGLSRRIPFLIPFFAVISYLFSPIVFFYPRLGAYMVAVKEK